MTKYPLLKLLFQIDWAGFKIGFSEVTGLDVETEVIESRCGVSHECNKIKMKGMQKFSNITMKRGVFEANSEYFKWCNIVKLNTIKRRNLTISLLSEKRESVIVWDVRNAWPTKIQSTGLKADRDEVVIESIELAHEGLTIIKEG